MQLSRSQDIGHPAQTGKTGCFNLRPKGFLSSNFQEQNESPGLQNGPEGRMSYMLPGMSNTKRYTFIWKCIPHIYRLTGRLDPVDIST